MLPLPHTQSRAKSGSIFPLPCSRFFAVMKSPTVAVALLLSLSIHAVADDNWPQFRGPTGRGILPRMSRPSGRRTRSNGGSN